MKFKNLIQMTAVVYMDLALNFSDIFPFLDKYLHLLSNALCHFMTRSHIHVLLIQYWLERTLLTCGHFFFNTPYIGGMLLVSCYEKIELILVLICLSGDGKAAILNLFTCQRRTTIIYSVLILPQGHRKQRFNTQSYWRTLIMN